MDNSSLTQKAGKNSTKRIEGIQYKVCFDCHKYWANTIDEFNLYKKVFCHCFTKHNLNLFNIKDDTNQFRVPAGSTESTRKNNI